MLYFSCPLHYRPFSICYLIFKHAKVFAVACFHRGTALSPLGRALVALLIRENCYYTLSMKLSGIQKQVIHLYRSCVRTVNTKPPETREHWLKFVRDEFNKYRNIPKKQFSAIEHLIRSGNKRLEMYSNPQIKDIH